MGRNLTNLYISESFNYVMQVSGSNVQNGLGASLSGSVLDLHVVSASYAVSASHEIVKEVSSSYANFAQVAGIATSSLESIYTASAVDSTITFTKGNGTTFDVTVAQSGSIASASYADYAATAGTATSASYVLGSNVDGAVANATDALYAQNTVTTGKNLEATEIAKGTPLYFTGSGTSGNIVGIYRADAGNPARMPAGGVAGEAIASGAEGIVLLDGYIGGVDTSLFAAGDEVFVAVGGGYTNVAPTGSANLIQHLGNVEKSAVNGSGVIQMMGEPRGLPNLQQNYLWKGGAGDVPQAVAESSLSVASAVSSSYAVTSSHATSIPDDITVRTIDVKGDGTIGVPDIKVSGSIRLGAVSNPFIILKGSTDNGTTTVNHTSWTVSTANQQAQIQGGSDFDGYVGTLYNGQYTVLVGNYPSWGSGTWQGPAISNDINGNYDAVIGFQPSGAPDNRVTILTPLSASAGITGDLTGNASTATSASYAGTAGSSTTATSASYASTANALTAGDKTLSGVLTQNFTAPGTNEEKAFFNITGAQVNSKNYNRVFYGIADYPSFGNQFEDYFAVEYYDGLSYNFGSEFNINGKQTQLYTKASGSGQESYLRTTDNYDGTSQVSIGSGNKIVVNGKTEITGSTEIRLSGAQSLKAFKPGFGTFSTTGGDITATAGPTQVAVATPYGGTVELRNTSTEDNFGLAADMSQFGFLGDWSGPGIFANDPSGNYPTIIGFQKRSNWTDGRVTVLTPMYVTSSNGFPLYVDGTMNTKRIHFDKNPFNSTPSDNLGAIRLSGDNTQFYTTLYNSTYEISSQSAFVLYNDTGSLTTYSEMHSNWGGTNAKFILTNVNGTRTGELEVDTLHVTGSANFQSTITGSISTVYNNNTNSGSLGFWQGTQAEYNLISGSASNDIIYFVV